MNARMRARRSSTEVQLARRSSLRTRMENHSSIWLSHEQCFGVYTKRMRWDGSVRTAARLAIDVRMPVFSLAPRSSETPQRVATRRTSVSDLCVSSWSAMNTHPASGAAATVRSTCAAKSASVRVGPTAAAMTLPVATAKVAMSAWVPCRMYSNSRRSTAPEHIGSVGAARSSAWMPVISSVLTTCVPCAWSAGAAAYSSQMVRTSAANRSGSSTRSVSQYRVRWGLSAAASRNQKPPDGAGGDALDDAPCDRLVGQLAGRPLADGPPRVTRWLAGHRDDLAQLLRRKRWRRARSGRVRQHGAHRHRQGAVVVRRTAALLLSHPQRPGRGSPPLPPELHRVAAQPPLLRDLARAHPVDRGAHDARAGDDGLRRRPSANQALQHAPLTSTHGNRQRLRPRHSPVLLRALPYRLTPCSATSAEVY